MLTSPKLTKFSINEYARWVDSVVRSDLPDQLNKPPLFEPVKTYQLHHHSKTCRKYRNEKCRFYLGKYFTSHTIIS